MNYIDAAFAPLRKTGQIKLYGPEAYAGMRKAGRLVAECLDQFADLVKPGLPTEAIDKFVFDFANGDVAQILGKTEGAVKSLQHRALATLQKHVSRV